MKDGAKEKISMAVGIALLSALNGEAGARVMYSLIGNHFKKRERETKQKMISEAAFRTALSRLKKQGIVESAGWGLWRLTKKGRASVLGAQARRKAYEQVREASKTRKDTIVIFDVPERRGKLRDYLRAELVSLGYEQLQKSVWIGGGPLPEAFMGFIEEKELLATVHIFTIAKKGTVSR
ncbi:MAG: hypothetical protein EXS60_02055 [Candidatus Pacebacteria bacterium]|nr:hypothetical protein [Candidatus Paceibacterota bacterium]